MAKLPTDRAAWRPKVKAVTDRQWGLITGAQLRHRAVSRSMIRAELRAKRLFEVHPRVYSVVPPEHLSIVARHAAAVLAGGIGAVLCSWSAAWWLGLIDKRPRVIHVATRRTRDPIEGIQWHELSLRDGEAIKHNRMPVTSPARTALDVAVEATLWEIKGILAELEFHFDIGPEQAAETLRKGHAGSANLRRGIKEHTPQLADTRTHLEEEFLRFLVERSFELPVFNHPVGMSTVDADFVKQNVIVELDGVKGHSGERRILRDHRRDLHRRADGKLVLRYHYTQLKDPKDQLLIEEELDRVGIPRRQLGTKRAA